MKGRVFALLLLAQVALMRGKIDFQSTNCVARSLFGSSKVITSNGYENTCGILKRWMQR